MKKFLLTALIFSNLLVGVSCTNTSDSSQDQSTPSNSSSTVAEETAIDLCDPIVRNYLNAETEEEQFEAYLALKNATYSLDGQNVIIDWTDDIVEAGLRYTLTIADNKDFKKPYVVETISTYHEGGIFKAGETYYYKVVDSQGNELKEGTLKTANLPGRFLNISGSYNFRDLGGWETIDGDVIRSNLIYRSGQLKLDRVGKEQFAYLGIKTEIDLRGANEDGYHYAQFDGTYVNTPTTYALFAVPSHKYYSKNYVNEPLQKIFEILANEDNYPVVFHCRAGADRTGFLSYLINGLCGVSYENLTRDYELTTASHSSGYRCRANIGEFGFSYTLTEEEIKAASGACWFKTHETIMNDYADGTGNLSYAIEQYLLDIGVDRNHIEQVKEIMIK